MPWVVKRRLLLLALLVSCTGGPSTPPTPPTDPPAGLVINEVVAANDSGAVDPANPTCPEHDDWIEVVNDSDEPVELGGIELSDGGESYVFPGGELAPGGHRLIWADGQVDQGPDHAPFRVDADGETLQLLASGIVLDSVTVPPIPRDHSYARVRDGSATWAPAPVPTPGAPNHRVLPDDPCFVVDDGFDDHSYPCIPDEAGYLALAGERSALAIVKFALFDFSSDSPRMAYTDSAFYTLHDQFYLYTVFNGEPFPHLTAYPPYDGDFRTWGQLEDWARTVDLDQLVDPQQARFAGERFYSPYFYATINGEDRSVGVGTVVHRPATTEREAFWGFELEYADDITYGDLVVYFETLEATGPSAFGTMRWLVRSPDQEALAQRMETEGLPWADRIVRYAELGQPGDVEVYNPGITAGRVRRVRAGDGTLDDALPTDVLVLDAIPDELPPCAALITSVPQTPLSHVALLARSRGIPNVYVAGIQDDPEWDAWSRLPTRVAVEASDDGLRASAMDFADYLRWRSLAMANVPTLDPVDPTTLPWTYELSGAPDMLTLRARAGGKAAGLRFLATVAGLDVPDDPLALSVRGYHAHIDAGFDWIGPMLDLAPFTSPNATRERFLVLEGRSAYDERYPTGADQVAADQFLGQNPPSTQVGGLARGDGLRGAVASTPIPPDVAMELRRAVEGGFDDVARAGGLRFRSSSTVEDVEGFNGAGLYISATGYSAPADGQRSFEDAIRAVWASYWGAEAYEERENAGLPHTDGGMGVLVHPRFDDAFELSNAVLTVSRLPDGTHEMIVNAQDGAVSVANPPTTCPPVLPETVRVRETVAGPAIERLTRSTEIPADDVVLSDAQLDTLFASGVAVVQGWLDAENAALPPEHRRSVLTLDLEAREMAAGWLGGGEERLVVKQARSLEPSAAVLPVGIQELPAPRDLLARAADVAEIVCTDGTVRLEAHTLRSDPFAPPDMGHVVDPFVVDLELRALSSVPALGWGAGDGLTWTHLDLVAATSVDLDLDLATADSDVVLTDGALRIDLPGGGWSTTVSCTGTTLWASPDAFLQEHLDATVGAD